MTDRITIGIIGGSGLGESLADTPGLTINGEERPDTPFGAPSAPITIGSIGGVQILMLKRHGEGHVLNPSAVPYRANIFALKALGCTHIIASGATGSLREHITPGDVVVCDQLIDRTTHRTRTFYERAAVHVEFADPFCPVMRRWLLDAASATTDVTVHNGGTYICMEGPSFSTRAESHMHRAMGADVVGMTALPEARLAREAEIAYALLALPTDYDCWRERPDEASDQSLIAEIIGNLTRATEASINVISAALSSIDMLLATPSPAHEALALGVWTSPHLIPDDERERLAPLWRDRVSPSS